MKTRTDYQKSCYIILFHLVKYLPIISALILQIHIILQFLGIKECFMGNLFDSSLPRCLLMLVSSRAFGFCKLHRSFVYYNILATFAIDYNHEVGFSSQGLLMHQIFFIISGFILFLILSLYYKQFQCKCGNIKTSYKLLSNDI